MVTRTVRNERERDGLLTLLKKRKLPMTVTIEDGRLRSTEQNRLQRLWLKEASEQLGDRTPEELRAYCKLTIAVPILRAENDEFRFKYDAVIRPLPYVAKLAIMSEPLDLPVTRLMTVDQKTRFLNQMHKHLSEMGVQLTDPDPMEAAR